MTSSNQIDRKREDVQVVTAQDLLQFGPEEPITEKGLRTNVSVGCAISRGVAARLGSSAIFNLMEDAATAEISRAQVGNDPKSKGKIGRW